MIPRVLVLIVLLAVSAAPAAAQSDRAFRTFIADLWTDALTQGIDRATFERAFSGVAPDARVIAATKRQPEYGRPAGSYVASIASPARIAQGQRQAKAWSRTLADVERRYGVDRRVVLAIWGMETAYGAIKPKWDAIRSLATLAFIKYRDPFFREELLAALQIMQSGQIPPGRLQASWAGAMGQPQFMPSSFRKFAVDFDGNGRIDIWSSVPDVLGSIGAYLQTHGWQSGTPWGFEVSVPKGFDLMRSRASFSEWTGLGVRRADGGRFPDEGHGILFFPAGFPGPAFVATVNFDAIKTYNDSDVYALSIGHLADRIAGGAPFKADWPKHGTQLPRDDRIALQKQLAKLGYDQTRFTAHIDFKMRDFVRIEQKKHGLTPDGHPDRALLERLGLRPSP